MSAVERTHPRWPDGAWIARGSNGSLWGYGALDNPAIDVVLALVAF